MTLIQMNPAQINKIDSWGGVQEEEVNKHSPTYYNDGHWQGRLLKTSEPWVHRTCSHTLEAEIYPAWASDWVWSQPGLEDIQNRHQTNEKKGLNTKVTEFKFQGQYLGSSRPRNWKQGSHLCSLCTKTYKVLTVYRESVNTQILFHCCCSFGAAVPSDWQSCLSLTSSWD